MGDRPKATKIIEAAPSYAYLGVFAPHLPDPGKPTRVSRGYTARTIGYSYPLTDNPFTHSRPMNSPSNAPESIPDALLLLATGCAHCPAVLESLNQMLKQGRIGRLEAINIQAHPEAARAVGTRSVPWTRIGPFEFEGSLTPAEVAGWTEHATRHTGVSEYFSTCLEAQKPDKVIDWLDHDPHQFNALIGLMSAEETPMAVRIGVGVVMEHFEGDSRLQRLLPELIRLCGHPMANIRADAAHYLGLTHAEESRECLNALLEDEHPDVREIAGDSLEHLL
ncbi:MAG: HEAT repeat domain-containing protein [Candidatus Thiodiazotropha sp.]